jgi:hypothetical protein
MLNVGVLCWTADYANENGLRSGRRRDLVFGAFAETNFLMSGDGLRSWATINQKFPSMLSVGS